MSKYEEYDYEIALRRKPKKHTKKSRTSEKRVYEDDLPEDLTEALLGKFGRWQLEVSVLMSLLKLPAAWYQLNIVFMAPPQEFWCQKSDSFKGSEEEWRRLCCPLVEEHPCLILDPEVLKKNYYMDRAFIPLVPCEKFVYDTSIWQHTMTSDWDLVCSSHWLIHITQFVMIWGNLVGSILFGVLADKYGRKMPLIYSIIIMATASLLMAMAPTFNLFIFFWFINSVAVGGIGLISFVISLESVSGKWRTIIPILYQIPFGIGSAIMAGIAYILRDWKKLNLVLALLSFTFLVYYFFLTESPRWLLAKSRVEEYLGVIKYAAKKNGMEYNEAAIRKSISQRVPVPSSNLGFRDFLKSKNMRMKSLLLSGNWFCLGLTFFTFSQYLGTIGSNVFYTVALAGITSSVGSLICVFIITRVGRKVTVIIFEVCTAICLTLMFLIPRDVSSDHWSREMFAEIGFASMAGTIPSMYLYTGELYPTVGRNAGVSGVTMFARFGSMLAPLILHLDSLFTDLALIILTVVAYIQIIFIIPLPETKDCGLPATMEEAENFVCNKKTQIIKFYHQ